LEQFIKANMNIIVIKNLQGSVAAQTVLDELTKHIVVAYCM